VATVEGEPGREVMFMLRCDAPGVTLKPCPEFSGMEGTGTYSVQCKDLFITSDDIVADPTRPYIARIRGGFVCCSVALRPASSRAPSTACGRWSRSWAM
jgi:alkylation response protein AidB-like acyl-CoA dehydrogenase